MENEEEAGVVDLRDFVRSTLLQIIDGVHQARVEASTRFATDGTLGMVAPPVGVLPANKEVQVAYGKGLPPVQDVEFDLAVTVATAKKGGGGFAVKIIHLGGSAETSRVAEQRIRFKVPIAFPLPSASEARE